MSVRWPLVMCLGGLLAACGGGSKPTATPGTAAEIATAAAPTTASTVLPTRSPAPLDHLERRVYQRSEQVDVEFGVLFLDPSTGGGVVWEAPRFTRVQPSRSGRYLVWNEPVCPEPANCIPIEAPPAERLRLHLTDTISGRDLVLGEVGEQMRVAAFSPDESEVVVSTLNAAFVVATASGQRMATITDAADFKGVADAHWTSDGKRLAASISGRDARVYIVEDSRVSLLSQRGLALRWSHDGTHLAVAAATGMSVVDIRSRRETQLPAGGGNPRWSPDDGYLGVSETRNGGSGPIRIFDTSTWSEVLRVGGRAFCVGEYWVTEHSVSGREFHTVSVPGGELSDQPVQPETGGAAWTQRGVEMTRNGVTRALLKTGTTAVSSPFDVDGGFSTTSRGQGVALLGYGGKGLCQPGDDRPVRRPPFAD